MEIAFEAVSKSYGTSLAISDLDLEIRSGEFLTLLGPSGSGKSTLLMLLAGFEQPTRGTVRIGGRDMAGISANRRNQGVVFQGYALFPHMTVAENLAYPLTARGVSASSRRELIAKALERVRMQGFEGRYSGQLSGGQQQRVALARAIVYEPPLLLMDESLSALDRKLREEMQIELKALHQELGSTIVYVTHDQDEALTMSDRIAVLSEGRIAQLGKPEELYDAPRNAFVASFLGESNLIPATILDDPKGRGAARTTSGLTLACKDAIGARSGESVLLLIRPERIALRPPEAGKRRSADRRAVVRTAIFTGDSRRYVVEIGGETLRVRQQRSGSQLTSSPGDEVDLVINAEDVQVLKQ